MEIVELMVLYILKIIIIHCILVMLLLFLCPEIDTGNRFRS